MTSASRPPFVFVDCYIATTAAAFVSNNPFCPSCPAGCCIASCHGDASHSPTPPHMTPALVTPTHPVHWRLHTHHRLLSRQHLPSTGASARATTSHHSNASHSPAHPYALPLLVMPMPPVHRRHRKHHCYLSCRHLPSTSASACALPLVTLLLCLSSGWLLHHLLPLLVLNTNASGPL